MTSTRDPGDKLRSWSPPSEWGPVITTVDMHTGGEPLRVVVDLPPALTEALSSGSVLERRREMRDSFDCFRTRLMGEPRGHADMYGCVLMAPERGGSDFAVLFLHNEGYSTMCGHAVIALGKLAVLAGLVSPVTEPETAVTIDAPAGRIRAWTSVSGGRPGRVRFHNVPSFAPLLDGVAEVDGVGSVRFDLAYGGAFYAFVDGADVGVSGLPGETGRIIDLGRRIKRAVASAHGDSVAHPTDADLGFLYGVIFVCRPAPGGGGGGGGDVHSRHVCVFADGEVDRSPTGTGVSARLAILHRRGQVDEGELIVVESVVGSRFGGKVVGTAAVGPHPAVVPEVIGEAHVCGRSSFCVDPDDALRDGFFLR